VISRILDTLTVATPIIIGALSLIPFAAIEATTQKLEDRRAEKK